MTQTILEINKIITKLPESKLEDLLIFLRKLEDSSGNNLEKDTFIDKIFKEDKEVLKKLAK